MWTTSLHQHPLSPLPWLVILAATLFAAKWELRGRTVKAGFTLLLLMMGLASSALAGGAAALAESWLAAALLAVPYLILYLCGRGGAPEARMMAAVGAWLGVIQGAMVLLAAGMAAFALGLAAAVGARRLVLALPNGPRGFVGSILAIPGAPTAVSGRLPQSPAIFAGIVVAAIWSFAWL